jgi:hypothetical protein
MPASAPVFGPPFKIGVALAGSLFNWDYVVGLVVPGFGNNISDSSTQADVTPTINSPATTDYSGATISVLDLVTTTAFFDGTDYTAPSITPPGTGGTVAGLQLSCSWGPAYKGDYTDNGITLTRFVGFIDAKTVLVAGNNGGDSFVTTFDLTTQSVTGSVAYSAAGATDWYMDKCGNVYACIGGTWSVQHAPGNIPSAAIQAAANTALNNNLSNDYTKMAVAIIATDFVATLGYIGATQWALTYSDGSTELVTPGTQVFGAGNDTAATGLLGVIAGVTPDNEFFTGNISYDSAYTYANLQSCFVTYGITTTGTSYGGGGAPPTPPEWTPPKPVPPYVPPDPGRIIPARAITTYDTTNIAHETTGNY